MHEFSRLFLFKDVISLGASFYLITYFEWEGDARRDENQRIDGLSRLHAADKQQRFNTTEGNSSWSFRDHLNEERLRVERDRLRLLLEITNSMASKLDMRRLVETLSTDLLC